MNKKLFFDLLYIVLIISLIAFMIWIYFYFQTSGMQCLNDPIAYYSARVGKECSAICPGDLYLP